MHLRRAIPWLFALTAIFSESPVLAEAGAALVVLKDGVNLRAGPSTSAAVVDVLSQAQRLEELARDGEWVRVRLVGGGGAEGWVHGSLVGADAGAIESEAVAEPAAPQPGANLATFAQAVEQLNAGARAQGYDFYGPVTDLGGGTVQVAVTEKWLATPETFRQGNFDTLFALWQGLIAESSPPTVRLVDPSGAVVMERTGAAAATAVP